MGIFYTYFWISSYALRVFQNLNEDVKMNPFVSFIVLAFYLTGSPMKAFSQQNDFIIKDRAKSLLITAETDTEETILNQIKEIQLLLENTVNPFEEGKKFIQAFIDELNSCYGTYFTIADACTLIRNNIEQFALPEELHQYLLMAADSYDSKTPQTFPQSSQKACASMMLLKNKHTKIQNTSLAAANSLGIEFELPDKMAIGFTCALAGALLCIIPGAQGAGLWMIGTGAAIALDGLGEGERPYYRDITNDKIIPFGK